MTKKEERKRKLLKELMIEHPEYICLVKNKLLTDDIIEECMNDNPDIFAYLRHPSIPIINIAFEMDGGNIANLHKDQRNNLPLDTIRIALESDIERSIDYININELPLEMRVDAFLQRPDLVLSRGADIPESYVISEIQKAPNIIKYVNNPTEEMKCLAISLDPYTALYFQELTDKMMDIIDEKYPQLTGSLPNYTRNKNKDDE